MKFKLAFFVLVLVVLISGSSALAQFEGAVWEILTSDTLQHSLSQNPLAATPMGFHMTYARSRGSGNGWEIYYRFLNYYGAWDDPVVVESVNPAFEPSISAREFGTFRIAIFYDAGGDIYGDVVSSPWEIWEPVNLTNTGDNDCSVTSAIDMEGTVHLSWVTEVGGEYKIAYGTISNGSFSMEVLQGSELGDFGLGAGPFSAVVDSIPHLFYRGVNFANYHIHHAYKSAPDSSWEIEFLYTPNIDDYRGSAVVDTSGDIHLSISGNTGWGTPGHIYYRRHSYQTGSWSAPELVSDTFSIVDGHIGITDDGVVFVTGAGVAGNIYTGDIYLSDNSSGAFETVFLANYPDGICPALAFLPGPVGALILNGRISHPGYENQEIIYYGPQQTDVEFVPDTPKSFISCGNYPNPFNSNTTIYLNGSPGDNVKLNIFDILGRKIIELSPYARNESGLLFKWDGLNGEGVECSGGTYLYIIDWTSGTKSGRMTYLK
jgi:hypothetical protein